MSSDYNLLGSVDFPYPTATVAIVNPSIKSYQTLQAYGIQLVTSYEELEEIDWKEVKALIIQAELNWVRKVDAVLSTYDGYYLLVGLLNAVVPLKGTVGFITRHNQKIYNQFNSRLYPFMEKLPSESIYIQENNEDFDKKFFMNYYHVSFPKLQKEYNNGFLCVNTGGLHKKYTIKHQNGEKIVFAIYDSKNNDYVLRKKNILGFYSRLGKADLEHEIIEFLKKKFAPVFSIEIVDLQF